MAYRRRSKRHHRGRKKNQHQTPFTGRYKRQDRGQNIRQGKEWREFVEWCARRHLKALPAHPWTVAAYVRWAEPRKRMPYVLKSLQEITRMHLLRCHKTPERDPIVLNTLRQIEVLARTQASRAGLFRADDFAAFQPPEEPVPEPEKEPSKAANPTRPIRRVMRSTPRLVRRGTS